MTPALHESLNRQGRIWLKARNIIADALAEMRFSKTAGHRSADDETNAAAIMARLACADLLICTPDEIKD